MDEDVSLVLPQRDYSNICKLEDPRILEAFLDEPLTFIAETITGALAVGKTGVMAAGGRIVQALLKGQLYKQWAKEFHTFREKGAIPDDFAEKKYGFQTWVELMTVIDEDSPDADRLEALKAMFYSVNKVGVEDTARMVEYQLWRIAKQLNSGDLVLLRAFYENDHLSSADVYSPAQWMDSVIRASGLEITELVHLHMSRLLETKLLTKSPQLGRDTQITALGRRLCTNIQTYRVDFERLIKQEL